LAFQKRATFFHSEERDEKYGQVVVDSFKTCLVKTAGRAHPGLIVKINGFCLYPGNNKKHEISPIDD
jgi:hypothetical protein